MFDPSIIILWILHRLVGLKMLSASQPLAIFNVRVTNFTARMLGPLWLLGYEIVYFGISKYHLMQEKPGIGFLTLWWTVKDS